MPATAPSVDPLFRIPDRSRDAALSGWRRAPWSGSALLPRQRSYLPLGGYAPMTTRSGLCVRPLMAGAGGENNNIAGHDVDRLAAVAAEAYLGAPARDGHHLVDHRMILDVRINAVAPHLAPAVCRQRSSRSALPDRAIRSDRCRRDKTRTAAPDCSELTRRRQIGWVIGAVRVAGVRHGIFVSPAARSVHFYPIWVEIV